MIRLAHSLGRSVIAEGVETEGQLAVLRDEGCDVIQGFWFARPMEFSALLAFLARRGR